MSNTESTDTCNLFNIAVIRLAGEYLHIVTSTTHINPLHQLHIMGAELKALNYRGEILFDQLVSNGNASNRFLVSYFDGETLTIPVVKPASELQPGIHEQLAAYYQDRPHIIYNSNLSEDEMRYMLDN